MTIKKIIAATDFSEESAAAATHAMGIARHTGAEVVLTHTQTLPNIDFALPYAVATPGFSDEQIKEILDSGRKRLHADCDALQGQGVPVSDLFIQEVATRGIAQAAEDSDADLIVMGTHGRHGLARFFLGSVAQWVAQRASCDVLATRSKAPSGGYKHILVPTDFSPCSIDALARATELIAADGVIDVVHFWSIPVGAAGHWGELGESMRDSIRRGATSYGNKLIAEHSEIAANLTFSEVEGDVRQGILDRSEEGDYDLVVMGSHGLKGVKKLILGSVAEAVLRHAKNSIYIARAKSE